MKTEKVEELIKLAEKEMRWSSAITEKVRAELAALKEENEGLREALEARQREDL